MFTVKKLAELLGVSSDVVRHYTSSGILNPLVNTENNYKYFDEQDLLHLANARVNRSFGLSVPEVLEFQKSSLSEQKAILEKESRKIEKELERVLKIQKRLKEVETFLNQADWCTIPGRVKDVRRDPIHSIYTYGAGKKHSEQMKVIKAWAQLFPYAHLSIKVPKEELNDSSFAGTYSVEIGLGMVHKYIEELGLSVEAPVETVPEGRFLIIYLKTYDILNLSAEELEPLTSKAKELNVSFTHNSSGRLLAIEETEKGPLFSILIRVRIGD